MDKHAPAHRANGTGHCQLPSVLGVRFFLTVTVARISKSAVSLVSKPAGRPGSKEPGIYGASSGERRRADLEIGDTAGLETCATLWWLPARKNRTHSQLTPPHSMLSY